MSRVKAVVAVLAVAIAAVLAEAQPAAASYSQCNVVGYVCFWTNLSGEGQIYTLGAQPPGTCYSLSGLMNDKAVSFYNHMGNGRHIQFYEHACGGSLGHGLHKQCGQAACGGSTAPYADGEVGSFYKDQPIQTPHNDRAKASAIFFNTG